MKYEAHRGVFTECPENTFSAFRRAVAQGFDMIELDPALTSDGKIVVLHDKKINRTARTSDGGVLCEDILIKDITYEQALSYDFGIYFSKKYAGERIPLLSDVFEFAKENGIKLKLDSKIQSFDKEALDDLFKNAAVYGNTIGITSDNKEFIRLACEALPECEIHYDGEVSDETLKEIRAIAKNHSLTVWLPIRSSLTSWVTLPFADTDLATLVKNYAKLGLWILSKSSDLSLAKELGADIIETTGTLKPPKNEGYVADMHTHTYFSHDSQCVPEHSVTAAIKNGLGAVTFTEHCDANFDDLRDQKTHIYASVDNARMLDRKYDNIDVLGGAEIGEGVPFRAVSDKVLAARDYDVVIGSVHTVYMDKAYVYSAVNFSDFSSKELHHFLSTYFDKVLECAEEFSFDILAHLTCPLRYISGKYKIEVDLSKYSEKIDAILLAIIKRGIALEINTSTTDLGFTMPCTDIIKRYRELGGYLVTLGSDAHAAVNSAKGFPKALRMLSELGFENIYVFKKREAVQCKIKA